MGLHFLGKMKIMVVRDIERDEVDFICKTLNCRPIASVDHLNPEMLASADTVEEFSTGAAKVVKVVMLLVLIFGLHGSADRGLIK